MTAPRGPAGPATRRYLLAGLLRCGRRGRRLESAWSIGLVHRPGPTAWSNGKPAYRCRHGYTSASHSGPSRPKNLYVHEGQILPRLAALAILHASRLQTQRGCVQVAAPAQAADLIDQLRTTGVTLTCDPHTRALHANTKDAAAVTVGQAR